MDLDMTITKISHVRKAGEPKDVHKIVLKSEDGHILTLTGDSDLVIGFPLGEIVSVTVEEIKTLNHFGEKGQ